MAAPGITYKSWLKVDKGILVMKDALTPTITAVIQKLHADVVAQLPACTKNCSISDKVKTTGTFTGCNTHSTMAKKILAHHTTGDQPMSVNWDNTDASQWYTDAWAIAKLFMGRDILATNTGVADTDASNLCMLMRVCKDFKEIVPTGDLWEMLTERNKNSSLAESTMKENFEILIDLLQVPGLADRTECIQGVKNLIQIRDSALDGQMEERADESSGAMEKLKTLEADSKCGNTDSKVIGGDTNASSSYVDKKGPQLENEKEDSIKRAMYCIIDAAHSIKGLHIRRYSRRPNELEVIAAVDEGLSLVDMERQLQHIAGEDLRVKLTIGSFPKFKFTCGSLGSGDIVDVAHVRGRKAAACIMGYVSNNIEKVYALTVGHVFASGENFPSECRIVTRDKVKVTGTVRLSVLKTTYMPERYGAVHDLALIEINNPIVASNTLTVDGYDYHPRIYREDANIVNKDVRLWRPTNGNNATTARVAAQDHADDGTFLYYILQCEAGGAVSVQGDSGTLVCSMPQPNVGNVPVVDAYAYIFASTDEHSFALPIVPQLQDLLAGSQMNYRNFNFFRNFNINTEPTLTYR